MIKNLLMVFWCENQAHTCEKINVLNSLSVVKLYTNVFLSAETLMKNFMIQLFPVLTLAEEQILTNKFSESLKIPQRIQVVSNIKI